MCHFICPWQDYFTTVVNWQFYWPLIVIQIPAHWNANNVHGIKVILFYGHLTVASACNFKIPLLYICGTLSPLLNHFLYVLFASNTNELSKSFVHFVFVWVMILPFPPFYFHLPHPISSNLQPLITIIPFRFYEFYFFLTPHISDIIQYLCFSVWHILLNIMPFRSIHIVVNGRNSFLHMTE